MEKCMKRFGILICLMFLFFKEMLFASDIDIYKSIVGELNVSSDKKYSLTTNLLVTKDITLLKHLLVYQIFNEEAGFFKYLAKMCKDAESQNIYANLVNGTIQSCDIVEKQIIEKLLQNGRAFKIQENEVVTVCKLAEQKFAVSKALDGSWKEINSPLERSYYSAYVAAKSDLPNDFDIDYLDYVINNVRIITNYNNKEVWGYGIVYNTDVKEIGVVDEKYKKEMLARKSVISDKAGYDSGLNKETGEYYLNKSVKVGYWSYLVTDFIWTNTLGKYSRKKPDYMYLYIILTARNDDKDASYLPSVKLVDENGNEFDSISNIHDKYCFSGFEKINPTLQKMGTVWFDIPQNRNYKLKLSGGLKSNEYVYVELKK